MWLHVRSKLFLLVLTLDRLLLFLLSFAKIIFIPVKVKIPQNIGQVKLLIVNFYSRLYAIKTMVVAYLFAINGFLNVF